MANRFLSNLRINDAYTFPDNDGSVGQAIVTDGAGNLTFGSAAAASADSAESTHLNVKNTSGASIAKGTPVYVTGNVGNTDKLEIAPADASNASHMPAIGLLESTLANNGEGFVVQGGLLKGLVTDTIDGSSSTANDTVYVKAGGGLTLTKPTGSTNFIQNIAKVARVHSSNGSLIVSSILRTNDVPNLPEGKIWVGDDNTTVSTIVHLDELNGRVGIGTASPSNGKLVIQESGTSTGSTLSLIGTNTGGSASQVSQISSYQPSGSGAQDAALDFKVRSNADPFASPSTIMTLLGSGNVGIGTTTPTARLMVKDSSDSGFDSGIAIVRSANTQTGYINMVGGAMNFNSPSIPITFRQSGSEIIRIDSSGRVGIGMTPSYLLDLQATEKLALRYFISTTFKAGIQVATTAGDMISTSAVDDFAIRSNSNILFASGGNIEKMRIHNGGDISFRDTSNNEAFYWDASTARLGIGTTNPNRQLHVKSSTSTYVRIESNSTSNSAVEFADNDDVNVGRIQYDHSENSMEFRVNDTESMRITSGGNVGIGTTSPSANLDVVGGRGIYQRDNSGGNLVFDDTDIADASVPMSFIRNSAGSLRFGRANRNPSTGLTTGSTESMRITSSGNVGINETNPSTAKLVIETGPTSGIDLYRSAVNANFEAFRFRDSSNANTEASIGWSADQLRLNSTNNTVFTTGGAERMRIDSSGNVGIGTTSPNAKLTVAGDILTTADSNDNIVRAYYSDNTYTEMRGYGLQFSRTSSYIRPTSDNSKAMYFGTSGATWSAITFDSNVYEFQKDGATSLYINSLGNVGIGTDSPDHILCIEDTEPTFRIFDTANILNQEQTISFGTEPGNRTHAEISGINTNTGNAEGGLIFKTNSGASLTERMRIDSSGNVGIGKTAASGYKLDIEANNQRSRLLGTTGYVAAAVTNNGGALTMGKENSSGGGFMPTAGAYDSFLISQGAVNLLFGTNNTERMRITSGGNVGIGTDSPADAAKLTLMGNQTFGLPGNGQNTNGRFLSIEGNTGVDGEASGRIFFTEHNSTTASMSNYGMSLGYRGGGTSVVGADGNTWTGLTQINNGDWGMFGHNNNAAGVKIMQGDRAATYTAFYSSGSETMRVTGGNVGIGTTSASTKLEVSSTAPSGDRTLPHNVLTLTAESSGFPYNGFGGAINFKNRSYTYGILNSARIRSVIDSDSGSNRGAGLAFDVTNSSQVYNTSLFLKYDGNVGIGTTSPASKLEIGGATGSYSSGIGFAPTGTGARIYRTFIGGDGSFRFDDGTAGVTRLMISSAGYVGIGTTSPTHSLSVEWNTNGTSGIQTNNPSTGAAARSTLELRSDSAQLNIYATSAAYNGVSGWADSGVLTTSSDTSGGLKFNAQAGGHTFQTSTNTRMVINNSGNVGIGTTSPDTKLDIDGGSLNPLQVNSTQDYMIGLSRSGVSQWWLKAYTNGAFALHENGVGDKIYIAAGGNVGIGTTSPTQKLHVNGNARLGRTSISTTSTSSELTVYLSGGGSPIEMNTASGTGAYLRAKDGSSGSQYWQWGTYAGTNYVRHFNGTSTFVRHKMGSSSAVWDMSGNNNSQAFSSRYTFRNRSSNVRNIVVAQNYYASQKFISFLNDTSGYEIGRIMFNGTSNVTYSTSGSDIRLKENIQNWNEDISSKITALQPKTFTFKHDLEEEQQKGFIAQNEADNFPEAYPKDPEGYHTWNPSGMVVYLMKALKEQIDKTTELESRIEQLEAKI